MTTILEPAPEPRTVEMAAAAREEIREGMQPDMEASESGSGGEDEHVNLTADRALLTGPKHPLESAWCLWHDNPQRKTTINSWALQLRIINNFGTIEDFWNLYHHIKPASDLTSGSNYHLFRKNVEPKWEDPGNRDGGRWWVQFAPRYTSLDQKWLWSLLVCIGEVLDAEQRICGVAISARKSHYKIAIWTREAANEAAITRIGMRWKQELGLPQSSFSYVFHSDAVKGRTDPKYTV